MAGSEIRSKIKSVVNTRKITSAMEKVAASKMKGTQRRMLASRPYAEHMLEVIHHVAQAHPDHEHVYMKNQSIQAEGLIVVTSDRGLCGGLNTNLLRAIIKRLEENQKAGIRTHLGIIGSKAHQFFKRIGGHVEATVMHLGESPTHLELVGLVTTMMQLFLKQKIQKLTCAHNQFKSAMIQKPYFLNLLPLTSVQIEKEGSEYMKGHWDYVYEGEPADLLTQLIERFIEAEIYQAVLENIASEQAARMMAMKSASDNAAQLIEEMKLLYNKARQAAITQELAEIVSGAAAV